MMKIYKNPERSEWPELLLRPKTGAAAVDNGVKEILSEVKKNGDEALRHYNEKFDGWSGDALAVSDALIDGASAQISNELKEAIGTAKYNIEKFHLAQREEKKIIETSPGIQCWRQSVPIERVGLYIPGGSAPLFSTLLMLGVPAKIAGCGEVIICTPANQNFVHPALLYTAGLLGIRTIYKIGGAQAIAAMAYGTESISLVYKIFGPGNSFVTKAKQLVNAEGIAIDMPAGPSEVAVFADDSAHPDFVAADLLSQAEHGPDSQVVLVCLNDAIASKVFDSLEAQLQYLPRQHELRSSLSGSRCVVMQDVSNGFDFLNAYAPEHLIIASDCAAALSERVVNAGSVFLGHYAPESAGDYISGTNHTLPTNGFAKVYSSVSLDSFVRKITFQSITIPGLEGVAKAISVMADAEGLAAHKNAVDVRIGKLKVAQQ